MTGTTLLSIADPLVGAAFVLSAGVVWGRSRSLALVLLFGGACWYAGALAAPLVTVHQGALVHVVAAFPQGRTRRPVLVGAVAAAWLLALLGGVLASVWPSLVLVGLLGVVLADRAMGGVAASRRGVGAALVAAVAFGVVLVVAGVNVLADLDADLAMALTYDGVVAVTVAGLATVLVRNRWTDDTVAELVGAVDSSSPAIAGLEGRLRRILGDPGLTIGVWSAEREQYLDGDGEAVPTLSDERFHTVVPDEGGAPTAVLVHDPGLRENLVLLDAACAAVRLALANAQMRRAATDRVEMLVAARRRMVEAADGERRALARRLDAGPRRHLLDARRILEETACADIETGRALCRELEVGRTELRDLANGVRPAALTDGGLRAALPLLAAGCAVPTSVTVDVDRLDPGVEAAVYFVCAEALANVTKHARATEARVAVALDGSAVVVTVDDDGVGGANPAGSGLQGLADRVEALGGHLEVEAADAGGVLLAVRLPLTVEQARS